MLRDTERDPSLKEHCLLLQTQRPRPSGRAAGSAATKDRKVCNTTLITAGIFLTFFRDSETENVHKLEVKISVLNLNFVQCC